MTSSALEAGMKITFNTSISSVANTDAEEGRSFKPEKTRRLREPLVVLGSVPVLVPFLVPAMA